MLRAREHPRFFSRTVILFLSLPVLSCSTLNVAADGSTIIRYSPFSLFVAILIALACSALAIWFFRELSKEGYRGTEERGKINGNLIATMAFGVGALAAVFFLFSQQEERIVVTPERIFYFGGVLQLELPLEDVYIIHIREEKRSGRFGHHEIWDALRKDGRIQTIQVPDLWDLNSEEIAHALESYGVQVQFSD